MSRLRGGRKPWRRAVPGPPPGVDTGAEPAVVILDEEPMATLHLAAGLRRAGWRPSLVLSAFSNWPIRRRLVAAHATVLPSPPPDAPEYLDAVGDVVRQVGAKAVLPCTDAILRRVWETPTPWRDRLFPAFEPWQLQLVANKRRMHDFVGEAGIATPRSLRPPTAADVPRAVAELGLPVVVKAITSVGGQRVRIAASGADAERAFAELARPDEEPPSLQEHVDGSTWVVGGLFLDGEALRLFAFEKLDLFPPGTGPSTRLRAVTHAALLDAGLRTMKALRWTGLGSVEFVGDPQRGFHFVEVNPRIWGSIALAVRAGVDLWAPLAELLAGRPVEPDLAYESEFDSVWFPPRLQAVVQRGTVAEAAAVATDLGCWRAADWRQPGVVAWETWGLVAQWLRARQRRATEQGSSG